MIDVLYLGCRIACGFGDFEAVINNSKASIRMEVFPEKMLCKFGDKKRKPSMPTALTRS